MKKYKYNGSIEKLMHQNRGEIIDIIEGCLIDNYLINTKRGYMAIIESFVNTCTSNHTIYFSTDPGEIDYIWDRYQAANNI